ncbi:MAG: FKBP-type peptidyl-prolyl cis-trans isomerase [Saprospiraceae bacterium]
MTLRPKFLLFILLGFVLNLTSCSKGESFEEQIDQINKFVAKKNWTVSQVISDGVYVVIDNPGSEEKPSIFSTLTVKYKGYYYDEEVFDQSDSLKIKLSSTIRGWQLGIPEFGKGGSGKLLITSDKAYGSSTSFGIRPNAMMIFEIEVLDF